MTLPPAVRGWGWRPRECYGAERAKDIAAEYRYQYGGPLSVFDAFRGRGETFGRDDIELLCLELATGEIPTTGTFSWLTDRDPADVIEILWQAGFLTAEPASETRPADNGAGPLLGPYQVQHLNLAAVQRFQVYPMFRAYLDIRQPTRR